MSSEVAPGELGQRLLAFELSLIRRPIAEQDEGLLLVYRGPDTRDANLRGVPEQVVKPLATRVDSFSGKQGGGLRPSQAFVTRQCFGE